MIAKVPKLLPPPGKSCKVLSTQYKDSQGSPIQHMRAGPPLILGIKPLTPDRMKYMYQCNYKPQADVKSTLQNKLGRMLQPTL